MNKISLSEYVAQIGQCAVAKELGITQTAVRKALFKKRKIFIFLANGQFIQATEERAFPTSMAKRNKS